MKLHSRWFQLCASLVAMIMIANLQYAWTLFVKPMQLSTHWTLPQVQWAFTLFVLCQTWVQPLEGWLIDRVGQRGFISAAGALCGIGWGSLGFATTLPELYTRYAIAGVGAAFVYSASMGSALKWFHHRRGLASGIMAAGFASGTSVFIPLIAHLIRVDGYRTAFLWTGAIQGTVILLVAQFLRLPPREDATIVTGSRPRTSSHLGRHQFVMMTIGGLLVTAQAGPIATAWGFAGTTLVLATTLSPIANGGGRVFWGLVSDRIGRETTMGVAFALQAVSLLMVLTLGRHSTAWFIVTLMLTYFTWGEIYALFPAALADYFGTRNTVSNNCILYTAKGVGSIVAGGLAAEMATRYGTWSPAFYGSASLALIAAVSAVGLRRSVRGARLRAAGAAESPGPLVLGNLK
jgi:OFA family oxalate/formate antiporter-like MFS transporter